MTEPEPDIQTYWTVAANDAAAPIGDLRPNPFPAIMADGSEICFRHLSEFSFTFDTQRRKGVTCNVVFSTHCFSDKYDPDRHSENVEVIDEGQKVRCFDKDRYELSKCLMGVLLALPGSRVHQTPETNFAIITTQDGRDYRVFFNVRKNSRRAFRLYVESAYAPDHRKPVTPASHYQKVRFIVLVDTLLDGKPLKFNGR